MRQNEHSSSAMDYRNHFKNGASLKSLMGKGNLILGFFVICCFLTSCATAHKMNRLSTGMTKQQVIQIMGRPSSTSAQGGAEYMLYKLSETDDEAFYGITRSFYVRLINGYVESYGKVGDFDSTKDPTVNINTNSKVESSQSTKETNSDKMFNELKNLKELFDRGIITQQEYDKKKKEILEKY